MKIQSYEANPIIWMLPELAPTRTQEFPCMICRKGLAKMRLNCSLISGGRLVLSVCEACAVLNVDEINELINNKFRDDNQ